MARLHTCTVLHTTPERRQLWQFSAQGNFPLAREQNAPSGDPLPVGLARKSWSEIWQPKLNVAWLPADKVFLRVVQLPASTPAETRAMVELQLEKLSPFPVAQVVWSVRKTGAVRLRSRPRRSPARSSASFPASRRRHRR